VKHLIIFWSSPSTMIILLLYHLAWDHHFMSTHLVQGLVPRFHQLSKTKLGLSPSLSKVGAARALSTTATKRRKMHMWRGRKELSECRPKFK
jgi:hypothetical protein